MNTLLPDKDRRVIPRWREFRTTLEIGELDGRPIDLTVFDGRGFFEEKLENWRHEPRIETAADLVTAALVLGRHRDAEDAARFLLLPDGQATAAVKTIAEMVLAPEDQAGRVNLAETKDIDTEAEVVRLRIRTLRAQLRDDPRNGLHWVDLSRAYSMLGQRERSVRAMERALALTRDNRFVLRSAARLFVHIDEPDRAHQVVMRADSTREDPWLLSTEIAVAAVAGRKPLLVRQGRHLLARGDFPPVQTTELSSALATLEMSAGDMKQARRLFKDSLVDPTDNSLAQAGWAATKITGVDVPAQLLEKPRSFEARALQETLEGRWQSAIRQYHEWLLDEPFSSRPAAFGSYLASVAEDNYRLAEEFALRGLRANPDDPVLLNNLAVALVGEGRIDDARAAFSKIGEVPETLRSMLSATAGLFKFRSGDTAEGRRLYREAMTHARRSGDRRTEALAAVHLAREELLAGTDHAPESLRAAAKVCEGLDRLEVLHMLRHIMNLRP
jgi:tetratricopeptide (TPR) repeat protein